VIYTLTVTDALGQTATDTVGVTVIPPPGDGITYGQCIDDVISPIGDQDTFAFTGHAGFRITAYLHHESTSRLSLQLFRPDNGNSALCGFSNVDCQFDNLNLLANVTYLLTVDGDRDSTGEYTLCLNRLDGKERSISYGQSLDDELSLMGDQDTFVFSGEQDDRVTVYLDHPSTSRMSLLMTGPDNLTWMCGFSNVDCQLDNIPLPVTANYVITVDGDMASIGAYTLYLNRLE
jgi:hypothetical protein